MSTRIKTLLIAGILSLSAFVLFAFSIYENRGTFFTDEMYWIQTGRILPYMAEGKFKDDYWQEHPGFTNFNGAKWIFALGMRAFGHTDFSSINYPPSHVDQFAYADNQPFPADSDFYPFVKHGRLISALVTALCVGFIFLLTWQIVNRSYMAAIVAATILTFHPTIQYIATHAIADGMLLAGQLSSLIITTHIVQSRLKTNMLLLAALGAVLGYSAAIKINGSMFYAVYLMTILIWSRKHSIPSRQLFRALIIVTFAAEYTFLIIHPNFFFYTAYSPVSMIYDRIDITRYHIGYFSGVEPAHVLLTFPKRLFAMYQHVFTPALRIFFFGGAAMSVYLLIRKRLWSSRTLLLIQWINLIMTAWFLLLYVVFDDQRYFLPLLPFVSVIAASGIPPAIRYLSSFGRYWRASAK